MERREVLKAMAASFGASMALPQSVFGRMATAVDSTPLHFFRPAQRAQVAMIAEAIIPRTDTPGAIEAGVPDWIEALVQDCFSVEDQRVIVDGLATFTKRCQDENGTSIDKLNPEQQVAFLSKVYEEEGRGDFLHQFKELTKFTYVNSELGGTQALEFMLVPGRWDPAMPITPGQKAWTLPK